MDNPRYEPSAEKLAMIVRDIPIMSSYLAEFPLTDSERAVIANANEDPVSLFILFWGAF